MEGNAGRVHKAFTYSSRYFIVMDLTVLEAHETTTHYNASTLPNKSGKGSVLGSFFDRGGRRKKVPGRFHRQGTYKVL